MTTAPPDGPPANRLLERQSRADRSRLLAAGDVVALEVGATLCEDGRPLAHAYLLLSGFASLACRLPTRIGPAVALVGNEGLVGATLLLGVAASPWQGVVRGAGSALRVPAADFASALRGSPRLASSVARSLFDLTSRIAGSAACVSFHPVRERLACRLLQTRDRTRDDRIHLTHDVLADMLGVQRSAVTLAAGALRRRGAIRYVRGDITILARSRLESSSCTCYAASVATDDES